MFYLDQLLDSQTLVQFSSNRVAYHQSYYLCSQLVDLLSTAKPDNSSTLWYDVYDYTFKSKRNSKDFIVNLIANQLNKI